MKPGILARHLVPTWVNSSKSVSRLLKKPRCHCYSDNMIEGLAAFFNTTSLEGISPRLHQIAVFANCPEWLRGLHNETDIPRYTLAADLPYVFPFPPMVGQQARVIDWIVENLEGEWNCNQRDVSFALDFDAVKFRFYWDDGRYQRHL